MRSRVRFGLRRIRRKKMIKERINALNNHLYRKKNRKRMKNTKERLKCVSFVVRT